MSLCVFRTNFIYGIHYLVISSCTQLWLISVNFVQLYNIFFMIGKGSFFVGFKLNINFVEIITLFQISCKSLFQLSLHKLQWPHG